MEIEFGNVETIDTRGTGWLVGYSDWTKANIPGKLDLRHFEKEAPQKGMSVKWLDHKANDPNGQNKPVSEGRTLAMLVSEKGKYRVELSEEPDFPERKTEKFCLEKHGDFIVWGAGLYHRWFFDEDTSVLTVRWTPLSEKKEEAK